MTIPYHRIASRLINQPLAVTPGCARAVMEAVAPRMGANFLFPATVEARPRPVAPRAYLAGGNTQFEDRLYSVNEDGVAVLSITGELVARSSGPDADSGLMSFASIQGAVRAAVTDHSVKALVLDIQSEGGEVSGMLETAEDVAKLAAVKPVYAIANDMCCSAAYALCCTASKIFVTQFGVIGSIGALVMHADMSGKYAKEGVNITIISSAARKAETADIAPLTDEAARDLQHRVDVVGERFVEAVAKARGLSSASVFGLQGTILQGDDAVAAGLADAVGTIDAVVMAAASAASGNTARSGISANSRSKTMGQKGLRSQRYNKRDGSREMQRQDCIDREMDRDDLDYDNLGPSFDKCDREDQRRQDEYDHQDWRNSGTPGSRRKAMEDDEMTKAQDGRLDDASDEDDQVTAEGVDEDEVTGVNVDDEIKGADCTTDEDCAKKYGATEDVKYDSNGDPIPVNRDKKKPKPQGGAYAERARIRSILGNPHARGRTELAEHLAYNTSMHPANAILTLKKAPKGGAGQVNIKGAGLGGSSHKPTAPANDRDKGAGIVARMNKYRGTAKTSA
jgi:signal peptide peptidase SppA